MSNKTSLSELTSLIHYYLRRQLFQEAAAQAKEAHKSFDDVACGLWAVFAAFKTGSRTEANSLLATLEFQKEAGPMLARLKSLLGGEKEARIDSITRQALGETALANLAMLALYCDNVKEAKDLLKSAASSGYVLEQARAMVELRVHERSRFQKDSQTKLTSSLEKARAHLSQAQLLKPENPLTLLLFMELEERCKATKELSIWHGRLTGVLADEEVLLVEKANLAIIGQKWEPLSLALDTLQAKFPNNLQGMKLRLFEVLVSSGSISRALEVYSQILFMIEKSYGFENMPLLLSVVQLVSRVAGKSASLLKHSLQILQKARKASPETFELLSELGYAQMLAGELKAAEECYQRASKLSVEQTEPFLRLVQIKLYKGEIEDAEATLDFFKEISATLNKDSSETFFLEALLYFSKAQKLEKSGPAHSPSAEELELYRRSNELFDSAIRSHIASTKSFANNVEFYVQFNPSFLLELAQLFIKDAEVCFTFSKLEIQQVRAPEGVFGKSIRILEILVQKIPGLLAGHLALLKAYILTASFSQAEAAIKRILQIDALNQQAHVYALLISLLKAQKEGSPEETTKCLANASSANFELLQNPEFQFLKAQAEMLSKDFEAAKKSLLKARQLISENIGNTNGQKSQLQSLESASRSRFEPLDKNKLPLKERPTKGEPGSDPQTARRWAELLLPEIDCEKAVLLATIDEKDAATEAIQQCIVDYSGGETAIFVTLANSQIALINKNLKTAMDILKNVEPGESGYRAAQRRLATLYLEQLKQPRPFLQCFQNIAKHCPGRESQRQLAEAHFSVGEFDEARAIFQELEASGEPSEELTLRIGECLVLTHSFIQAKAFYSRLVAANFSVLSYRIALGELLLKTGQFAEIIKYIDLSMLRSAGQITAFPQENKSGVHSNKNSGGENSGQEKTKADDLTELANRVRAALLLYEHYFRTFAADHSEQAFSHALESLELASDAQKGVIEERKHRNLRLESARKTLGEISFKTLQLYETRDGELATLLPFMEDAIRNDPENQSYHLLLGELYWRMGDLEIAKEKAKQVLKGDFSNPSAVLLFADCLLQGRQNESGLKGFTKIFEKDKQVNNSCALLLALFPFYRNLGRCEEFRVLIDYHRRTRPGLEIIDPFVAYSSALYSLAIRNPNNAIEELVRARQSPELFGDATFQLIDIYLHDSCFNIYSNFFHRDKFKAFNKQHLRTAKTLLKSLPQASYKAEQYILGIVLEALEEPGRMATSAKTLGELLASPTLKPHHSMLLYFAVVFNLRLKNKENLKDLLIRTRNLEYRPRRLFDEYYFRSLLLCADTLLFKDKLKPAKSLIDTCISCNKSCLQAYEYLLIYNEKAKEGSIEVLKEAFEITGQQDPNIGYKLAKELMIERRAEESFKICKLVLEKYPKFKSIETDVLIKVREELLNNY